MNILCLSLWKNSWVPYWTKYLAERGHSVQWHLGEKIKYEFIQDKVEWADLILCHWATGWSILLSNMGIQKPVFVIHRSYEVFMDVSLSLYDNIRQNKWENITRLFMLNESHYPLFKRTVPECKLVPTFIKNGIDLDYFPLLKRGTESKHNVAWIANLNHKKGEMLAAHATFEMYKIDPLVQLHHLGKTGSMRIALYLDNIFPYVGGKCWTTHGHKNEHGYVLEFLKDKQYILSCSLVEGHPLNVLEAMATGCKPLIHRYPGVQYQFPERYIWTTFDDLVNLFQQKVEPEEYREFIETNYDFRKCYKPVVDAMDEYGHTPGA